MGLVLRKIAVKGKPEVNITQEGDHFIIVTKNVGNSTTMDFNVGVEFQTDAPGFSSGKIKVCINTNYLNFTFMKQGNKISLFASLNVDGNRFDCGMRNLTCYKTYLFQQTYRCYLRVSCYLWHPMTIRYPVRWPYSSPLNQRFQIGESRTHPLPRCAEEAVLFQFQSSFFFKRKRQNIGLVPHYGKSQLQRRTTWLTMTLSSLFLTEYS